MPETLTVAQVRALAKSRRRHGPTPEQAVKTACLALLALRGIWAWVNATTGVWDARRGLWRTNAKQRGAADILGLLPHEREQHGISWHPAGRLFALEVKAPGRKPSKEQAAFLANVNERGGLGLWCADVADLARALTAAGY